MAVVITAAFARQAEVQAAALGVTTLAPVVITHPLSTLTGAAIRERAAEAATQVRAVLTSAP